MTDMTIRTNHVPRDIVEAWELTEKEREDFDYLDWAKIEAGEDSASFFRYKGHTYDLSEFERWDNPMSPTRGSWDGYRSDSYFSGVAVRYVGEECDQVVVATILY